MTFSESRFQSNTIRLLLLAVIVGVVAFTTSIVLAPYWSFYSASEVQFVLPPNFRGAFVISPASASGVPPLKVNGAYQVFVPPSGAVHGAADEIISRWHRQTAVMTDGQLIPSGTALSEDDVRTVALWDLYTDGDGATWYYVGTRTEMKHALTVFRLTPGDVAPKLESGEEAIAKPLSTSGAESVRD